MCVFVGHETRMGIMRELEGSSRRGKNRQESRETMNRGHRKGSGEGNKCGKAEQHISMKML